MKRKHGYYAPVPGAPRTLHGGDGPHGEGILPALNHRNRLTGEFGLGVSEQRHSGFIGRPDSSVSAHDDQTLGHAADNVVDIVARDCSARETIEHLIEGHRHIGYFIHMIHR
jgi:hypothetical protein